MSQPSRRREGRPFKGDRRGETPRLSARISPELRERLERAAEKSQHKNLSTEVEARLWQTFRRDDLHDARFRAFGGRQNFAACYLIADLMTKVSKVSGKKWSDDPWTFDQVAKGIERLLRAWKPDGGVSVPPPSRYPGRDLATLFDDIIGLQQAGFHFADPNRDYHSEVNNYTVLKRDLGDLALRDNDPASQQHEPREDDQ